MDSLGAVKSVITKPDAFFAKWSEKEFPFRKTVQLGIILLLVDFVGYFILGMLLQELTAPEAALEAMPSPGGIVVGVVLGFVWLWVWGAHGPFQKSVALLVYGSVPRLLFSWIPVVGLAAIAWSFVLLIVGTHKMYGLSIVRSVIMWAIPMAASAAIVVFVLL